MGWANGKNSPYISLNISYREFQDGIKTIDEIREEFKENSKNEVGKNLQVLLPIEINGVVNEYIFSFKITHITYSQ